MRDRYPLVVLFDREPPQLAKTNEAGDPICFRCLRPVVEAEVVLLAFAAGAFAWGCAGCDTPGDVAAREAEGAK